MLTRERVHEIFGIKESYKLPDKIMELIFQDPDYLYESLKSEDMELIFQDPDYLYESLKSEDMRVDFFRDYFQDEQGDRNALKQDFTPDSICEIVARIVKEHGHPQTIADMCAGTGSLTIHMHKFFPDAEKFCYEVSERTVPFLLLNMMIRNMAGWLVHGDLLTGKIQKVYKLEKGARYSAVSIEPDAPDIRFDAIVSNPPYSLKYDGNMHPDFEGYAIPPKSKADYAFVLHELAKIKPDGCLELILPCGVLFRNAKEGEIREKLIQNSWIHSVIELPEKLFLNTVIPVVIVDIQKTTDGILMMSVSKEFEKSGKINTMNKQHIDATLNAYKLIPVVIVDIQKTTDGILMMSVSKEFEKSGKINTMNKQHIDATLNAYKLRRNIDKMAKLADMEILERNEFNLNVPRYVDVYDHPPVPDLGETLRELVTTEKEIKNAKSELFAMMKDMEWTDGQAHPEWDDFMKEAEALWGT